MSLPLRAGGAANSCVYFGFQLDLSLAQPPSPAGLTGGPPGAAVKLPSREAGVCSAFSLVFSVTPLSLTLSPVHITFQIVQHWPL